MRAVVCLEDARSVAFGCAVPEKPVLQPKEASGLRARACVNARDGRRVPALPGLAQSAGPREFCSGSITPFDLRAV